MRIGFDPDLIDADRAGAVLLHAFPDRLAIRRRPGQFQLRTGSGAWLPDTDPLAHESFVVAADLDGKRDRARIRLAAALDADDVARIWSAAEKLFRSGVHPAVSLCVRREGEVVLDRSIGWAKGVGPEVPNDAEPVLNTPGTPHVIFSASKALTACVAHLLDQQGKIHIGDRVAEYIPEYARHGKEGITIGHVLSHRGGVPNLPGEAFKLENICDRDAIVEILVDAQPQSRPGTALAYHAISGGYSFAEVVKGAAPYVILMLIMVLLLAMFPGIALWLPTTMRG